MFDREKIKRIIFFWGLALVFSAPIVAQEQTPGPRKPIAPPRNEYGVSRTPDLTQENLGRVAASANQIRGVLVKDEGLMVELKRWVAKEATDNGQVVEDSTLTDEAIFERLNQDIKFRSVATLLLQKYGYLLPMPNPESDLAKEKDFILKERARRQVQLEGQEDAQSLQPKKPDADLDRASTCDSRRDEDCEQSSQSDRQKSRPRGATSTSPNANPQVEPDQTPSQNPSRILRAEDLPQGMDSLEGLGGLGSS